MRVGATARAVIDSAPDAIVAFDTDGTVLLWNLAAERCRLEAAEVIGREPPSVPDELKAEHNAVLERARAGGPITYATRRARKDGGPVDVLIDTSVLSSPAGQVIGWVHLLRRTREDEAATHRMAERAQVVRRLGDVVADMNAQRDLHSVLDRIAASLRELTGADAGGFVIIEDSVLRLVSLDGLPASLRGRTAALRDSLVGELMRSAKTVMMTTDQPGAFDDLVWSALPGLHTIALSLSHVGGRPYGALYALYSERKVGRRRARAAGAAGRARRGRAGQRDGVRGSGKAAGARAGGDRRQRGRDRGARRRWLRAAAEPGRGPADRGVGQSGGLGHRRSRCPSPGRSSPTGCAAGAGSTSCATGWRQRGAGAGLPRRHGGQGA